MWLLGGKGIFLYTGWLVGWLVDREGRNVCVCVCVCVCVYECMHM